MVADDARFWPTIVDQKIASDAVTNLVKTSAHAAKFGKIDEHAQKSLIA